MYLVQELDNDVWTTIGRAADRGEAKALMLKHRIRFTTPVRYTLPTR